MAEFLVGKKVSDLVLVCRHLVAKIVHHMWCESKMQEADEKLTHLL